jgi:hypothetical protein
MTRCPKCSGIGRYINETMPGVWEIHPCSCKESMLIRQAKEQKYQEFEKRFEEAWNLHLGS